MPPKAKQLPFKKENTLDARKEECRRICTKYPDLIPVICEKMTNCKLPESQRRKYLVPRDITMGQFKYVIRKRIELSPNQALFVLVNHSVLAPTNQTVSEVYKEHAGEDGFLYMSYTGENTFG
jgi:GABA(A) receptor-associated protein